jgi:hypothetical protein
MRVRRPFPLPYLPYKVEATWDREAKFSSLQGTEASLKV